jgi:IS30 family transposase
MKARAWDQESRRKLESLLADGYSIQACAEMLGKAIGTVRAEVKRGCLEDEYDAKRYVRYRAVRATLMDVFDGYTNEEIRAALKELQSEARRL